MDYRPKKSLDIWLNDKGFYRKHVAMDETCFFRAVSDQIYNSQIYHEDIRKLCVNFAKKHRVLFKDLLDDSEWYEHIDKLEKHFVVCGDIEIQILSKMLKYDFIIVDAHNFTTENVTKNGYDKSVTLCKMRDNHFDSVCAKEHIENSGFCQSLVYKLLYENLFDFDNVDDIVQTMLYPDDEGPQKNSNLFDSIFPTESEDKDDISKIPPFPYKVAKALDPNQYRNIEFDAWNQTRKELRLKDWYLGGEDFKVGTKCLLVVENNTFDCYIQELNSLGKEDVCLVYVVEWASREIVKREELMPLPDAKPWPLPYAISRNSKTVEITANVEIVEVTEKEPKPIVNKRRRNRRRNANNNNSAPQNDNNNNTRTSVVCYEGCPLVASPNSQYENLNSPAICNEEENLVDNSGSPFEPLMQLSFDQNYSLPYESNSNNLEEDQSYNADSFVTDSDWTNYQTWLSSGGAPPCCVPISYPTPYVMPSVYLPNPQMFVATHECNTLIHQDNSDTKVTTMCTKYVEKTYSNNNNQSVPNLNYHVCQNPVQVMPWPNYSGYQPQIMPGSNYPKYEYQMIPGPSYPAYGPQMIPTYPQMMPGPFYPKYEPQMSPGLMMQTPTPDTPVSPVPFSMYSEPVGPMTAVCPCYLVNYPVLVPPPLPQPNVPMLEANVPVSQLSIDALSSKLRFCNCNSPATEPCTPGNIIPQGYFREYNFENS